MSGEKLAAVHNGVPQMDLGPSTDVLTGCPKAQAMEMLIRVMNPQVLAVDELAGQKEIQMAQEAANCGIALFATAHGDSPETLLRRSGISGPCDVRGNRLVHCVERF